jgi:glycosyltransferase involved in cell wall biosynthesis
MMRRYVHHRSSYRSVEEQLLSYLPETDDLLRWHQHEIDIIHVFDRPWRQGWIGQILAEKYRKRLIISVFGEVLPHDDPIELIDAASEPYRSLSQDVLQRADRLASMTRSCAERVALLSLNPSTVYPLYFVSGMEEFIEPPAIDLYPHFPELKGKRIVLFVGQLQPRKGPDVLLRAMPGVIERFPDVVVVIVGADYGMHADLEALAAYLGVETSCVFTGPVPQDTLKALYKAATVFAFTTVSQIECLGLVFVQAMYARCAVVASDISGVPEVIRHGENGLLYPPGDAAALQNHIITLLGDPTLRQHLSAQAFADVNHQFAPAGLRDQIAALYSFDD